MAVSVGDKRASFRRLHESGCFVLPNPWDIGSARLPPEHGIQGAGLDPAPGFAWSMGRPDNGVSCDEVVAHLTALCEATDLPVNADFEGGFAHDPEGVAANVARGVTAGVAGLSIEDATGDRSAPLYETALAVERIRAARKAIDDNGGDVILVDAAKDFSSAIPIFPQPLPGSRPMPIRARNCLYSPGLRSKEHVAAVVQALAPKPVNVLVGAPGFTLADLADSACGGSASAARCRVAWNVSSARPGRSRRRGPFGLGDAAA